MRLNLGDDPAVIFIADQCGIEQDAVVGKLHRLWSWMSEHSTDGSLTGVSLAFVDRHVRVPGFGAAMIKAGWLEEGADGLIVPKFDAHMSESAKKRAVNRIHQHNKRERDVREMSDDSSDKSGTRSLSLSLSISPSLSIKERITDKIRENLASKGIGPEELEYWISELESFRSKNTKKFDREYSDLNLQIQAWRRRALGDGKAWDPTLLTYSKNGHARKTAPSRYLPEDD